MKSKLLVILLLFSTAMYSTVSVDTLYKELVKQEVKNPNIVLRQAILETGWFKSNVFKTRNNLFGMTMVRNGERIFQTYKSWRESVAYYKKWQDKYYTGGNYYNFLECVYKRKSGECVRYATSPTYITKLKSINIDV